MPAASPSVRSRLTTRATLVVCALALLATTGGASDVSAVTPLGSQISSGRRSQAYYESVMLSQDRLIARIKAQEKITRKALKQVRKAVRRTKRVHRHAIAVVEIRLQRLAELEARYADTPEEEIPEAYADRVRALRREIARTKARRMAAGRDVRIALRARKAREFRLRILKRQRKVAVSRREAAEGGLGAHIVRMTNLARQRAELMSSSQLAVGSAGFAWPAVGRITQTYGCTGFRLNPRRGSCRHFHDGLDIVSAYGSKVRSAADGVVAYAGWNPWDEGGRAWIMVVSHPDGFVTRYGHLVPGSRVRVGQFVRQGEGIGRMGNTGKSLGTHLHFEFLRGSRAVSPYPYLPDTMAPPRVTRFTGRDGKHKAAAHKRRGKDGRKDHDRRSTRKAGRDARSKAGAQPDEPTVPEMPASGEALEELVAASVMASAGAQPEVCPVADEGAGPGTTEPHEGSVCPVAPDGDADSDTSAADEPVRMQALSATSEATRPVADTGTTVGVPRPQRGTSPVPV